MSDSILQVNKIQDKTGNADGITIANTSANVTIGNLTATALTASGGISNLMNVYASIPFATSTITAHTSNYVKIGLLNQTDRVYMPKKSGFSVDASTDEIIVANAGTYLMHTTLFTTGAANSRENQFKWIVKNNATSSSHSDGTLCQQFYFVNAGTSNDGGTTEYITSGTTNIVELAANDHLMFWGLCLYGTQTVGQSTDFGKSHTSFIKIK
jgi:hypothetical protein